MARGLRPVNRAGSAKGSRRSSDPFCWITGSRRNLQRMQFRAQCAGAQCLGQQSGPRRKGGSSKGESRGVASAN